MGCDVPRAPLVQKYISAQLPPGKTLSVPVGCGWVEVRGGTGYRISYDGQNFLEIRAGDMYPLPARGTDGTFYADTNGGTASGTLELWFWPEEAAAIRAAAAAFAGGAKSWELIDTISTTALVSGTLGNGIKNWKKYRAVKLMLKCSFNYQTTTRLILSTDDFFEDGVTQSSPAQITSRDDFIDTGAAAGPGSATDMSIEIHFGCGAVSSTTGFAGTILRRTTKHPPPFARFKTQWLGTAPDTLLIVGEIHGLPN